MFGDTSLKFEWQSDPFVLRCWKPHVFFNRSEMSENELIEYNGANILELKNMHDDDEKNGSTRFCPREQAHFEKKQRRTDRRDTLVYVRTIGLPWFNSPSARRKGLIRLQHKKFRGRLFKFAHESFLFNAFWRRQMTPKLFSVEIDGGGIASRQRRLSWPNEFPRAGSYAFLLPRRATSAKWRAAAPNGCCAALPTRPPLHTWREKRNYLLLLAHLKKLFLLSIWTWSRDKN